jgi:hypothetical protein
MITGTSGGASSSSLSRSSGSGALRFFWALLPLPNPLPLLAALLPLPCPGLRQPNPLPLLRLLGVLSLLLLRCGLAGLSNLSSSLITGGSWWKSPTAITYTVAYRNAAQQDVAG